MEIEIKYGGGRQSDLRLPGVGAQPSDLATIHVKGEVTKNLLDTVRSLLSNGWKHIALDLEHDSLNSSLETAVVLQAEEEVKRQKGRFDVKSRTNSDLANISRIRSTDGSSGGSPAQTAAPAPSSRRKRNT